MRPTVSETRDGWTSFFEPLVVAPSRTLVQLTCAAAARAWYKHGGYATTFDEAAALVIECRWRVFSARRE